MKNFFILITSIFISCNSYANYANLSSSHKAGMECAIENALRYRDDLKTRISSKDKYKHCALSCIVTINCDVGSTFVLGLAKELYDMFGYGTPDINDLLANIYGIRVGMKVSDIDSCKRICKLRYL